MRNFIEGLGIGGGLVYLITIIIKTLWRIFA